jgi:hypothetical protein
MCDESRGVQVRARQGSRRPAKHLTDLDFADDIVLLTSTLRDAQALLTSLEIAAAQVGLNINAAKTQAMYFGDAQPSQRLSLTQTRAVEWVPDFRYLGSWVNSSEKDLAVRIGLAWEACNKLWRIWKQTGLTRDLKLHLFKATVESVLLYGSSCWSLTVAQMKRLDGAYTKLLRRVLNIPYAAHVTNKVLYGELPRLSDVLRSRRLRFAGHCFRREGRPESDLLLWEPPGTFRLGGRARKSFPKQLLHDSALPTQRALEGEMRDRVAWRKIVGKGR